MHKPEPWATWNPATRCNHLGEWTSLDGEEWFDDEGEPAGGPDFKDSIIKLLGGPHDGDVLE
jgi:hypothetical protein